MMYRLYGVFKFGYGFDDGITPVADFSQLCSAHEYVNMSRLVKPKGDYPFKVASLLKHYHDAYVEWTENDALPIDPKIGEK